MLTEKSWEFQMLANLNFNFELGRDELSKAMLSK